MPKGWPLVAPAHSCSVYLSNSPLGCRVKALWFDANGDGLDEIDGQFCHFQLYDDAGIVPFALLDDAEPEPRQYRDHMSPISKLGDEQYGVDVMVKPQRPPGRVDLCVYGWDGTDRSAAEWGV